MRIVLAGLLLVATLAACDSDGPDVPPVSSAGNTVVGPTRAVGPSPSLSGPVASGPLTLALHDSATTVHVVVADTGGQLYRVTTPSGGPKPTATRDGSTIQVGLSGGTDSVDLALADDVPWNVRLESGVTTLTVDATKGTLAGLTLLAGVSTVDATLGTPLGLPVIRESGGVSTMHLDVPAGTGVRVHAVGGAGKITLFGDSTGGVPGGDTVQTPGFGSTGYVVEAEAGLSTLVVD